MWEKFLEPPTFGVNFVIKIWKNDKPVWTVFSQNQLKNDLNQTGKCYFICLYTK